MASYTDKIPTFNPYVAQQPIEAMLKVGMYKQQKYEEGVKKIQTNIDNVAGLDIANATQQKYLQSKLNALGNSLKFLAAGDFSDFSLVNSVNGMTKQIVKDEDIQNAVSSTAKLRAGYKKREELAKKGLTDKNNDDYYDMFASEYVNSKDVKAKFNAEYVPYTNIVKKLQEALVNAGESSSVAEQLFVVDQNTGKPLVGPDGHYMYADAKTIDKLVTNKPAVLAAINNVMSQGNVKQQLAIDGWATYRNTEATDLLEPLKTQYDDERSMLQQQSVEITAMLNSTNLSPEQRQMYLNAAAETEAALLKNDNTFLSLSQQAENSPEEFKQNYYTQEFKQRLVDQFTKTEESHTTGTNEALQQQNWRDRMAFDRQVEANKVAYQNEQLKISQSGDLREWTKFYADYEKDPVTGDWNKKPDPNGDKKKKGQTYDANKALFSGSTPGDKVSARNIIEEDISFLTAEKNKMAFSLYADFIRTNNDNPGLSDETILAQAKKWAKSGGVTVEQYLDRWAKNIKNKYDENGLTPPPNVEDEFNNYSNTAFTLNSKINQVESARKSAQKEADVDGHLKDILAGHATHNFNINGQKFTITPQDMLQMKKSGWLQQLALGYGSYNIEHFSVYDKNLTDQQNKFLSQWYNMSPEMRNEVLKESDRFKGEHKYYAAIDKSEKLFNEKLGKIVGVTDTVTGTLPMGDADEIKASVGKVAAYVTGGERNYGSGSDREKILKALENPTSITWTGKKPTNTREDWVGNVIVTGKDGVPYTITNVNHKDLETFTDAKFTGYQDTPIQDAINMNTKTKSTNPVYMVNSPNAWRTAHYNGSQASPEVTRAGWRYRADVINSGGGYRLVNYVRPPGKTKFTTIYGNLIYPQENLIDKIYKTTSPAELNNLYLTYLHNQTKQ